MPDDAQIPVGGLEIANRLGVRRETVAQWKQRGLLPAPRWTVSGEDAWDWALDIEPWALKTRRQIADRHGVRRERFDWAAEARTTVDDYQSYEPAGADVVTVSRDDLQTALRYARGIDVDDDPAFDRLYAAVEAGK
jgi:hypothetical protein